MAKVLLIKTGDSFAEVVASYGDFEGLIRQQLNGSDDEVELLDARTADQLPELSCFDGVIITGSHAMVSDAEAWSERLLPYIQQMQHSSTPVLAICYGHQLLARALGGEAGYHPHGPEVGTVQVELTETAQQDPLFSALPPSFSAHVTHSQSALQLPAGAELLAKNAYEPHQAFRIGESIWGVQFHPEFVADVTKTYIEKQRQTLLDNQQDPDQLLANVAETELSNGLLQRFVSLL